jgi:cbb3-type cytochrome c oxidase subunit I
MADVSTAQASPTQTPPAGSGHRERSNIDIFTYDEKIVRYFVYATVLWGFIGMAVGALIALQMAWPAANIGEYLTFGRLRPLHTNAVIFAFAGNSIFAAIYYSTQRLCKARMYSDWMSSFHFWGWQAIIVSAAVTLPLGYTTSKEYAELEWPIDIAIAVVWIVFAVNFFGTLYKRREKHLYVALWFYIATIVTVAVLHVGNSLALPAGVLKSYPIYAGVQDALVQWWYGHNAVAFFLTTPFLGLMYYFMPKAAERPVFSYRLSIVHFWSLVFIYIWAGPHHLQYTSLPEWAGTLGMLFSVMLWMPSWGGMINGLFTLRGAWHKLRDSVVLKMFVIGITFYGMSTFEGPLLSIKSVNALSHYTDWTIGHVHSGALGWNGFMTFGMIYWLLPRLWRTEIWSPKLANAHFWTGTIGILLYVLAMYNSGITQGLMWRAFDEAGNLMYPEFIETVVQVIPMYWVRLIGGLLYLGGVGLMMINMYMTIRSAPDELPDPAFAAPRRPVRYGHGDGAGDGAGDGTSEQAPEPALARVRTATESEVVPTDATPDAGTSDADARDASTGTKKAQLPGTQKPKGPGTKKPKGPGTKKAQGPGTKKPDGPGTKKAQGPDAESNAPSTGRDD